MYRIKDFAYAQYTSTNAIIYHEGKLSDEEIKLLETGWEAVLDPRFKGRFSVSPMKCGVCYAPIHMFLDPQFKDKYGPDFLKKLAEEEAGLLFGGAGHHRPGDRRRAGLHPLGLGSGRRGEAETGRPDSLAVPQADARIRQ